MPLPRSVALHEFVCRSVPSTPALRERLLTVRTEVGLTITIVNAGGLRLTGGEGCLRAARDAARYGLAKSTDAVAGAFA
jgi:hypothetical protein